MAMNHSNGGNVEMITRLVMFKFVHGCPKGPEGGILNAGIYIPL